MFWPLRHLMTIVVSRPSILVLLLIVSLAMGLRLYGLQWDQGNFFHPDERSILMRVDCMHRVLIEDPYYQDCIREFPQTQPGIPSPSVFLDRERSPLNPHWFPLGSIILYLLLMVKVAFSPLVSMDLQDLAIAGRTMSALVDVGSVAMIYALGRRLFGSRVGLLAACLMALAVVHIQNSHFYRPETFIVFFTLASFWAMLGVLERDRWRNWLLLGLFVGLTFATKVSVLPLLLPLVLTWGICCYRALRSSPRDSWSRNLIHVGARACAGAGAAAAVYLFWTPYAVLDIGQFLADTLWETDIVRMAGIVPYTVQYIGTTPILYELQQTVVWALGVPLGVVGWVGLIFAIGHNVWRPRAGEILLLVWAIPFFLLTASFEVKFMRYVFPLMPVLILMGARLLVWCWDATRLYHRPLAPAALGLMAFVVLATGFYAFAFERIYTRPHPAVQASQWINNNVGPGTGILTDNHWDEGFPHLGHYAVTQLPMYEPDNAEKRLGLAANLADSDYLLSYSNRLYGSIPRIPERYPMSNRYYRLLLSGDLGYRLEVSFTTYPRLWGVAFVNDTFGRPGLTVPDGLNQREVAPVTFTLGFADENVVNYDHPLVLLFRNVEQKSAVEISDLLSRPVVPNVNQGPLLLTLDDTKAQRTGGTWSQLFSPSGWTNRFPILPWLLVVEAISLAALPLTMVVLRPLPDRGVLLAKPLGLLLVGYLSWLGPSLRLVNFSSGTVILALLAVAAISSIVLAMRWRDTVGFLRARWRYFIAVEVLFLVAFFAFLVLRMANPDLWHAWRGGEKPMDLAYLTAVVKSTTLPPYDPWYAGGYLNYYYFGQFLVGVLIKVTGIVPTVAYNLAVPLFFAMTIAGSFTVVYNLTEFLRRNYPQASRIGPVVAGIAAALFVVVLGNLDGAVQLIQGAWGVVMQGQSFPPFDFWRSRSMIPGQISITEFPFWTFLFADLHAHLLVIPFTLLALGIALAIVLSGGGERRWRSGMMARTLVLALTVGSFGAINTWALPTYLTVGVASFGIAAISGHGNPWERVGRAALIASAFVVLSFFLFLPYHLSRQGQVMGITASQWQMSFHYYLVIHGPYFAIALAFLAVESFRWLRTGRWGTLVLMRTGAPPGLPILGMMALAGVLASLFALVGHATIGAREALESYHTVVILLVLLGTGIGLAVRRIAAVEEATPVHLYVLLLLSLALAIGAGVELVTVTGDIDRMNTVFKFYLQAWVFYALVAAFAVWYLWVSGALHHWRRPLTLKAFWLIMVGLLLVCSAVYPVLGTRARLADRFTIMPLTLSGTAFTDVAVYPDENGPVVLDWDAQAIQWLQENVLGSPVVLEAAPLPRYTWSSRVSVYTGLPTVIGYVWHQQQQRGETDYLVYDECRGGTRSTVEQRCYDVTELYSTPHTEQALRLLHQYQVSYIYVGPVERLYYPAEGLAKFAAMVGNELEVAYQNPEVIIYRIL